MKFCDVTLSYTETSGGIRSYLDAKRAYLRNHTDAEHVLIVPGEEDSEKTEGRLSVHTIASPPLPGCEPYRFFWRPDKIRAVLDETLPDAIELGSFYVAPWPAFSYRKARHDQRKPCLVGGYFHTDIAEAYVGRPLRESFDPETEVAEAIAEWFAGFAEARAEEYVGSVFSECDLCFAASDQQAARLREYEVEQPVHVAPLGVDLETFHPGHRSAEFKRRLGVAPHALLLIYAGRLDAEKRPDHLVDALEMVPEPLNAALVLIGEGPMRPELVERSRDLKNLFLLEYQSAPAELAKMLASSDIYVTAGATETFGLSVAEAQACGLPVVGVDAGALPERVVMGAGQLAPVDDAEAFADAIACVASKREAIAERAREHAEQNYCWQTTFESLFGAYNREHAVLG